MKTDYKKNHLITSINFHYSSNSNNKKISTSRKKEKLKDENKENINRNSNISIINKKKYIKLKMTLQKQPVKKKILRNNFDLNQNILNLNAYKSEPLKIFEPDSFNNTSIHYTNHKNKITFSNNLVNLSKKKKTEKKIKNKPNEEEKKEIKEINNYMIFNSSISFAKNKTSIKSFKLRKINNENMKNNRNSIVNESFSYQNNIFINSNFSTDSYRTASKNKHQKDKLNNCMYSTRDNYQNNFFSPPKSEMAKNVGESIELKKSCRILTDRRNNNDLKIKFVNPDDFKIIKQIGFGSFGKIYKVLNIKNGQKYALKVMQNNKDNISYMQEKVHLIMEFEKKIKCDGLIKIYGDACIKKGDQYYYYEVLELADRDWEQEIISRKRQNKYYSEYELINILTKLVQTLSTLQKNHITHRDIKLQNILLLNKNYKICDFGEARKLNQKGIIVQPVRGSELYMSPIQFFGLEKKLDYVQHNTYKSDVFSLGMCTLFAANLGDECLYDIREVTDMKEIENILMKYLYQRYSIKFIYFLLIMLEHQEKNRPDFISLEEIISNSFKNDELVFIK